METKNFLLETPILNYSQPEIQSLIKDRQWQKLNPPQRVKAIYNYVRDEILFGYNRCDTLTATEVLREGYGQCNTKATLLMALLRACDIPCRLHGFTIDKPLQKGAITGVWYWLSPKEILHTWVEVYLDYQWFHLEGVILDKPYLTQLQNRFGKTSQSFCGYGAYTENLCEAPIEFNLNHTYIQSLGIHQDLGYFDSPDEFYQQHQQQLGYLKSWLYRNYIRHRMNCNVKRIRATNE